MKERRTMRSTIYTFLTISALLSFAKADYLPTWDSLDSRPLPDWFDQAKVGIFMHFGPYSVPGVQDAWFWLDSTDPASEAANYLVNNYPPKFTYQNFGSMLTMEFFNAENISNIVAGSGAKYFVFTSKHHDGFTNWNSTYTFGWNSVALGAKRNVIAELKQAFADKHPDIRFGLYYSLYEWFNPIYLSDKKENFTKRNYPLNKMIPEMKELVTLFNPDVLWVDGDWEAYPEYWGSQDFLSWLYNESPSKDTVVTNDRWGIGTSLKHGGYYSGPDKFNPGVLQTHKSWGFRHDIDIAEVLSPKELIATMVRTVSCGGNILVNVGPTKEGTILPIFQERLLQLGSWLKVNGDAIYSTSPWKYQNDSGNSNVWYTRKKNTVYAITLAWPMDDVLHLKSPVETTTQTVTATMLGYNVPLHVEQDSEELKVHMPSMSELQRQCGEGCQWAYAIELKGLIQEPQLTLVS